MQQSAAALSRTTKMTMKELFELKTEESNG